VVRITYTAPRVRRGSCRRGTCRRVAEWPRCIYVAQLYIAQLADPGHCHAHFIALGHRTLAHRRSRGRARHVQGQRVHSPGYTAHMASCPDSCLYMSTCTSSLGPGRFDFYNGKDKSWRRTQDLLMPSMWWRPTGPPLLLMGCIDSTPRHTHAHTHSMTIRHSHMYTLHVHTCHVYTHVHMYTHTKPGSRGWHPDPPGLLPKGHARFHTLPGRNEVTCVCV
jgi:hypothetical protein